MQRWSNLALYPRPTSAHKLIHTAFYAIVIKVSYPI